MICGAVQSQRTALWRWFLLPPLGGPQGSNIATRDSWDKCFSLLSPLASPGFPAFDKNLGLQEGNVWLMVVSRVDTAALRRNSARLLIIIPVAGLGRWVEEKAEKSLG